MESFLFALEWLKLKDPDEAVKYDDAVDGGRKMMSQSEAGKLGGRGKKAIDNIKSFKGGTSSTYLRARLERDHPEILESLEDEHEKHLPILPGANCCQIRFPASRMAEKSCSNRGTFLSGCCRVV